MALNQMDNFTFAHSNQQDAIYTQYTAQQIKALFDSRGDELRTALNLLITSLNSVNGASNIGTSTIQDIDGANIQAMLQSIRDKLKSKADGASGADYINATTITGLTGETVQSLLESMKSYIDGLSADKISAAPIAVNSGNTIQQQLAWLLSQIAIAATGSIPDGSLGEVKLTQALIDKINTALSNTGVLTTLQTKDKSSSVNAINEVNSNLTSHEAETTIQLAGGTANAITVTTGGSFTYTQFRKISFKAIADNTGNVTLNVDGKGAVPVLKFDGSQLPAGNIKNGKVYDFYYDTASGGRFFLIAKASGNVSATDVLAGKTCSTDNGDVVGIMPDNGAVIITPSTVNQTIANGRHNGGGYVKGDANLIASNIISGKSIFGVAGSATVASLGGKRWASGTVSGDASSYNYAIVSGLAFKPSIILIYDVTKKPGYMVVYWSALQVSCYFWIQTGYNNSGYCSPFLFGSRGTDGVTSDGFKLAGYDNNYWIAIE